MGLNRVEEELTVMLDRTGAVRQPVEDWGWHNVVWTGGPFARAHLERMKRGKSDVLHCVVVPHPHDPAPVFGFDVIALGGKLTGLFLDWTPVTTAPYKWHPKPRVDGESRPLPEWADFFSADVISIRPEDQDVWAGIAALQQYLPKLGFRAPELREQIKAGQQQYIESQRANPKTRRLLAAELGSDEQARAYIGRMLWPDVDDFEGEHCG